MNNRIETFKKSIKNKKIAVVGIGISNIPLIKYLIANNANVTAFDKNDKGKIQDNYAILEQLGCEFSLGEEYLSNLKGFDMVFRTPGMRYDRPELIEAQNNGAIITSEMELFFELCPCEIIGITGSDGKTTTTTLINLILKDAGYKCWLGGNIGAPLIDKVEEMSQDDKVIVELSSFQLHTMKISPHIAVITNLSPNHLDYHTSMQEYIDAKKNIFIHQNSTDKVILNYDNEITRELANEVKGKHIFFSRVNKINEGIIIKNESIINVSGNKEEKIMDVSDIIIPGVHNVENYMTAIAATLDYVSIENVKNVATTFNGVEHRIELVRELNNRKFYNDSIASSPTRTTAGLNSFNQKVILIAGGYDKNLPFDEFGKTVVEKVKMLFLIGKTADKIESAVKAVDLNFQIIKCNNLDEATNKAYESSAINDIILMSPACASFDMFKNFEERGNTFKRIVNSFN